jgi:plastocyanin
MRQFAFVATAACAMAACQTRADVFTVLVKSNPNVFAPAEITIKPGDGIVWAWAGGTLPHSSTSDTSLWDSGVHVPPFRYRHPFLNAGDYPYYCVLHGAPGGVGMSGVMHVMP